AAAPEAAPAGLAYALVQRYDKDKNSKLSRSEIGLEKSVFDQLDRDRDGELDTQELARFVSCQPPDLEIVVHLGGYLPGGGYLYLHDAAGLLVAGTRRMQSGSLAATIGETMIDLGGSPARPDGFPSARQLMR